MSVFGLSDILSKMNEYFVIYPIDLNNATPIGYDLKVGLLISLTEDKNISISSFNDDKTHFSFPPNSTNIIVTRENVWLSHSICGTIHARGSLALRGIIINSTNVDPNWSGRMIMRLYNSSHKEEKILKDEAFCTMIIHELKIPTEEPPKRASEAAVSRLEEIYGQEISSAIYNYKNRQDIYKEELEFTKMRENSKFYMKMPLFYREIKRFFSSFKRKPKINILIELLILVFFIYGVTFYLYTYIKENINSENLNFHTVVFSIFIGVFSLYYTFKGYINSRK